MVDFQAALKPYGASVDDRGEIIKNGPTGVRLECKGGRVRAYGSAGLLFSAPASEEAVGRFVESYWYWKRS